MKYNSLPMRSPTPFVPAGQSAGLKEKRLLAYSSLALVGDVLLNGDYNKEIESTLLLQDSGDQHLNHGNDPATDVLNLAGSVGLLMEMLRPASSTLNLSDYAHATLDGYHPSGDSDLNKHQVIFDSATKSGQVVYISSDGHVDLARADSGTTADAIGLSVNTITINSTDYILTEGSITKTDWSNISDASALVPGAIYYLSSVDSGDITINAPSSGYLVRIGRAINSQTLDIEIAQEVRL